MTFGLAGEVGSERAGSAAQAAEGAGQALYAELAPLARHGALIDHLYLLVDCGRLTSIGESRFASPFCEIAIGYCRTANRALALAAPPSFGRRARQSRFHGWLAGLRFSPELAVTDVARRALMALAGSFASSDRNVAPADEVIHALNAWIGSHLDCAPRDRDLRPRPSLVPPCAQIGRIAAAEGVSPRTLQRRVRALTGLPPKRYAALRRFDAALRLLAAQDRSLADIATELGFADQAHETAELTQHAGVSPARFRRFAKRQLADRHVRIFKDAGLQHRLTLLLSDAAAPEPALLPTG